ncbi:zinc finger, CCHC-type containing protein [Tanacetum coccineum]
MEKETNVHKNTFWVAYTYNPNSEEEKEATISSPRNSDHRFDDTPKRGFKDLTEIYQNARDCETELRMKLRMLRTDRGGEFTSNEFTKYCKENGIARQLTAPYSPQQNGVVERRNRTVLSTTRSMIKAMKLPLTFWAEAVKHAIYILNRVPTRALVDKTPYEALYNRKPNLENLRIFGCTAYAKITIPHLKKLDDRSIPMIYLGVEEGSKACRLYDPKGKRKHVSRDVRFMETKPWDWDNSGEETSTQDTFWASFVVEGVDNENPTPVNTENNDNTYQEQEPITDLEMSDLGLYLLHTRPDLSYSVGLLSRFMQDPKDHHLKAVKQVIRYIKGIKEYGIIYKKEGGCRITGYSDSSYGINTDQGKGTTGIVFYFGESHITWCTQKQPTVALSSCESEFMAATGAACQALWLKRLLSEITEDGCVEMMKMSYDAPSGMLWLSITIDDPGEQIRTRHHLHGSVFDASGMVPGIHHNTWKVFGGDIPLIHTYSLAIVSSTSSINGPVHDVSFCTPITPSK